MTFKVFLTQAPAHKKAHTMVAQHLKNKTSGKNYLSYPSKNGSESAAQIYLYVCVCMHRYTYIHVHKCCAVPMAKRMILS